MKCAPTIVRYRRMKWQWSPIPMPSIRLLPFPWPKGRSAQADKIRSYFLAAAAPEPIREAHQQMAALRREKEDLIDSIPTTMVMQEMEPRRDTFLLVRGAYDRPGDKVSANVPACLPPLPAAAREQPAGVCSLAG